MFKTVEQELIRGNGQCVGNFDKNRKAWNLCAIFDLDNVFTTAVDFCGKNFLRQIRF